MSDDDATNGSTGATDSTDSTGAEDGRDIQVRDEVENNRFALVVDGGYAGFAYYEKFTGMRDFTHTEIAAAFEGQGLSKVLIKDALEQTIAGGDEIVATCPAVRRFLRKNPEYREHVQKSQ